MKSGVRLTDADGIRWFALNPGSGRKKPMSASGVVLIFLRNAITGRMLELVRVSYNSTKAVSARMRMVETAWH